jgi:hypothetical protein
MLILMMPEPDVGEWDEKPDHEEANIIFAVDTSE